MTEEIWRPIPGFDGYEASNQGRIRSHRWWHPKIMTPTVKADGYHTVKFRVDGKYKHLRVNRAVLLAHIGVPPANAHAAHDDGNKGNNQLANLSWKTKIENERDKIKHGRTNRGERSIRAKLTQEMVSVIRELAPRHGPDQVWIARMLGVGKMTVYYAATERSWAHG